MSLYILKRWIRKGLQPHLLHAKPLDMVAYEQGRRAFSKDMKPIPPYRRGSVPYESWKEGYRLAEHESHFAPLWDDV
jgi:hypothetical protein